MVGMVAGAHQPRSPARGRGGDGGGAPHKECSSGYSTLIRPDLQENGIPGASRGPAARLNPLPLCQKLWLTMAACGDGEGAVVAISIVGIPILPGIQTVLPQESAGPVLHSMCHQDEDTVAMNCPGFLLLCPQKGCGSGRCGHGPHAPSLPLGRWSRQWETWPPILPCTWAMRWEVRVVGAQGPGDPLPTHGEQMVQALQLGTQLAPRSPWSKAGRGPKRTRRAETVTGAQHRAHCAGTNRAGRDLVI